MFQNWNERLGEEGLGLTVGLLDDNVFGTLQSDLRTLASSEIIICTP